MLKIWYSQNLYFYIKNHFEVGFYLALMALQLNSQTHWDFRCFFTRRPWMWTLCFHETGTDVGLCPKFALWAFLMAHTIQRGPKDQLEKTCLRPPAPRRRPCRGDNWMKICWIDFSASATEPVSWHSSFTPAERRKYFDCDLAKPIRTYHGLKLAWPGTMYINFTDQVPKETDLPKDYTKVHEWSEILLQICLCRGNNIRTWSKDTKITQFMIRNT